MAQIMSDPMHAICSLVKGYVELAEGGEADEEVVRQLLEVRGREGELGESVERGQGGSQVGVNLEMRKNTFSHSQRRNINVK